MNKDTGIEGLLKPSRRDSFCLKSNRDIQASNRHMQMDDSQKTSTNHLLNNAQDFKNPADTKPPEKEQQTEEAMNQTCRSESNFSIVQSTMQALEVVQYLSG